MEALFFLYLMHQDLLHLLDVCVDRGLHMSFVKCFLCPAIHPVMKMGPGGYSSCVMLDKHPEHHVIHPFLESIACLLFLKDRWTSLVGFLI